jgi:hypothetical protein
VRKSAADKMAPLTVNLDVAIFTFNENFNLEQSNQTVFQLIHATAAGKRFISLTTRHLHIVGDKK